MKTDVLRDKFLDFFKTKKHKIIISDSLVPAGDPTVLFTPAGMNQFKKEFLGLGRSLKRAATAQRCLRTDDLDKVGKTAGHHTFFEMLGNFSFGDYFKKEAIAWAFEFLVDILKMDKKRIWISVYKEDDEAYDIWKNKISIPEDKIIKLGDKQNFWPSEAKVKGPNGPCGPCSEIFFDLGKDVGCRRSDCSPACDCGRFVEVWNLVFTQFNRKEGGVIESLPRKSIDTGMGLERLAAVMQGVGSNFETDLFTPIIKEIKSSIKKQALVNNELIYAIADHIRAITFAIYDGVMPSNEERGYVVRKLIRRSLTHLSKLGIRRTFLYRLVPVVAQVMSKPYPELKTRQENIAGIVLAEEENFLLILESAPKLREQVLQQSKSPEEAAFELYDTYGIPIENTASALAVKGIPLDMKKTNEFLESQKERSKAASSMKGNVFNLTQLPIKIKKTNFVGYQKFSVKAEVVAILKGNSEIKKIDSGQEASIILDTTVFYPESGGQVADVGEIKKGKNTFEVHDVKQANGAILHIGKLKSGTIKKNDSIQAIIDHERRLDIMRNHTATHLLQSALRTVLGEHVRQQGSLVAPDRLRFDFTHFKNISPDELNRVEELVNQRIWDNDKTNVKTMPIEQARKIGALAFFEEKYEKNVRVLIIGDYSRELCGGAHLEYTGQIGLFKIFSEGSVASGVRRIEAVTGRFAYTKVKEEERLIEGVSGHLRVPSQEVVRKTEKLVKEIKDLQKRKTEIKAEQVKLNLDDILKKAEDFSGIKLITQLIPGVEDAALRRLVDLIKQRLPKSVCLLATDKEKKVILVMGVTRDLLNKDFNADYLIKEAVKVMNGSGGGRADFAFGAGDVDKVDLGFSRLREIVSGR